MMMQSRWERRSVKNDGHDVMSVVDDLLDLIQTARDSRLMPRVLPVVRKRSPKMLRPDELLDVPSGRLDRLLLTTGRWKRERRRSVAQSVKKRCANAKPVSNGRGKRRKTACARRSGLAELPVKNDELAKSKRHEKLKLPLKPKQRNDVSVVAYEKRRPLRRPRDAVHESKNLPRRHSTPKNQMTVDEAPALLMTPRRVDASPRLHRSSREHRSCLVLSTATRATKRRTRSPHGSTLRLMSLPSRLQSCQRLSTCRLQLQQRPKQATATPSHRTKKPVAQCGAELDAARNTATCPMKRSMISVLVAAKLAL